MFVLAVSAACVAAGSSPSKVKTDAIHDKEAAAKTKTPATVDDETRVEKGAAGTGTTSALCSMKQVLTSCKTIKGFEALAEQVKKEKGKAPGKDDDLEPARKCVKNLANECAAPESW